MNKTLMNLHLFFPNKGRQAPLISSIGMFYVSDYWHVQLGHVCLVALGPLGSPLHPRGQGASAILKIVDEAALVQAEEPWGAGESRVKAAIFEKMN